MKLSKVQKSVMAMLGHGWTTGPGAGMSIMINGKRMCNVDTLNALEKHGLVKQMTTPHGMKLVGQWKASDAGIGYQKSLEEGKKC